MCTEWVPPGAVRALEAEPFLLCLSVALQWQRWVQVADARQTKNMTVAARAQVEGRITSISIDSASAAADAFIAYVGTAAGNIYQALVDTKGSVMEPQLVQSAHVSSISAIAFPEQYGEVRLPSLIAYIGCLIVFSEQHGEVAPAWLMPCNGGSIACTAPQVSFIG